jgi:Flp pilus assembly pilin Flp
MLLPVTNTASAVATFKSVSALLSQTPNLGAQKIIPRNFLRLCTGTLSALSIPHSILTPECKTKSAQTRKGGERFMELLKRLLVEEEGQGLVEYTLIVVLVALVFWVAIKNTNVGSQLASGWSKVTACVGDPSACDSAS